MFLAEYLDAAVVFPNHSNVHMRPAYKPHEVISPKDYDGGEGIVEDYGVDKGARKLRSVVGPCPNKYGRLLLLATRHSLCAGCTQYHFAVMQRTCQDC